MKLVSEKHIMKRYGRTVTVKLTVTVEEGEKGVDKAFVERVIDKLECLAGAGTREETGTLPGHFFFELVYYLKEEE